MANRRKNHLDALEDRLTGPRRIALFGHRNVGKTTLLAMFYRQASSGQVPGLRLAAADPASAEYLAEKIAQIESGEPPAGTLAETELRLRLYHGPARFDLIVKDYQGEHVTLGSDEPIQEFFADCDAVFLCLDPEGSTDPAERRRRQQEVENLLERYIDRSDDGTTGRPVALLLTKFDRVLARATPTARTRGDDDPAAWGVERLVEAQYGMTRHALARQRPGRGDLRGQLVRPGGRATAGRRPSCTRSAWRGRSAGWPSSSRPATASSSNGSGTCAPDDLPRLARVRRGLRATLSAVGPRRARSATGSKALAADVAAGGCVRLAAGVAAAGRGAWPVMTPGVTSTRLAFEREQPPRRPSRGAGHDLLAWHPSLGALLARPGPPGPAEAGRVDGQGGRGPGRQRHRRRPTSRRGSAA